LTETHLEFQLLIFYFGVLILLFISTFLHILCTLFLSALTMERQFSVHKYFFAYTLHTVFELHSPWNMERQFSPCTRLRDILESQGRRGPPEILQELNLNVSTEELLSAERAFTYADLYAVLGNEDKVAWLTPHAAIGSVNERLAQTWMQLHASCRFNFNADGNEIVAMANSREHLLEICDVVLRLLAASVVHSVTLDNRYNGFLNAPSLALMEQSQSLKVLSLQNLEMDEHHCRVLGVYSRPGLEIELKGCTIAGSGASALSEVLGQNRGPTKLHCCEIDNSVLPDGLRGNSRLKSFRQNFSEDFRVGNALRENTGLVELKLGSFNSNMNDETWADVCDSLKTHPTLEILDLLVSGWPPPVAPDVITSRTQALVEMIKVNTSIRTIHVDLCYSEHEMYRESVVPYLETNRLRPRLLAIQKTRPIPYRAKVLGRALLSARTDANNFWMLLSGNAEVTFPSRTTTIAAVPEILEYAESEYDGTHHTYESTV
jgi:hypothetical protein